MGEKGIIYLSFEGLGVQVHGAASLKNFKAGSIREIYNLKSIRVQHLSLKFALSLLTVKLTTVDTQSAARRTLILE